jgi:hypothetical protein
MIRACVLWLALALLGSCTQKLICPAYQSSFIYDQEALRKKFSYFKEDSTPKIMYTASKNKYLVAVPESYRKKTRSLQTVEMQPVFPVIPDSIRLNKGSDDLMKEADVVDSSAVGSTDSAYAITKTKEKYNVDQDIYMWYFRDMLVLPDVRAAMETQSKNRSESSKSPKKKKGLFGNLFGKKKKPTDSLAVDDTTVPADSTAAPPKKKGIKGMFGGKKKAKDSKTAVKKDPAKKEEKDDGF